MALLHYELLTFYRSKKNLGLLILTLILGIILGNFYAKNYQPPEPINQDHLQLLVDNPQKNLFENQLNQQRLNDLKEKDYLAYAQNSIPWYQQQLLSMNFPPRYYSFHNYYGLLDGAFQYTYTLKLYENLATGQNKITIDTLEEKTASQTLLRVYEIGLPILLLISVLASVDLITKDRRKPSIIYTFPASNSLRIFIKITVASSFSILTFLILGFSSFLSNGLLNPLGSLQLPTPIYIGYSLNNNAGSPIMNLDSFKIQPIWFVLLIIFFSYFLLGLVLCLINLFLTLLIPNEIISILILSFVIILSYLPRERLANLYNEKNSWFPWTYFKIVPIITGYTQQWSGSSSISLDRGLLIFSVILCLSLLLLLLFKNKIATKKV